MTKPPRAILSEDAEDFGKIGYVIECSQDAAEEFGAFEEAALSEEEAWESNLDLDDGGATHE